MAGSNIPAKLRSLSEIVDEYEEKLAALPEAIAAFEAAGQALKVAASVAGSYGQEQINTGSVYDSTLTLNLRRSAWLHVWNGLDMPMVASAADKKRWEQSMADPAPFTMDNLRATFGPYLADPRANILRGMAEVFSGLDPAYKSHEKMKVGVKGLPKRVIISGLNSHGIGGGWDRIRDILNAVAAYQGKPLVTHIEMSALRRDGEALREDRDVLDPYESEHVHRRRAEAGVPAKTVRIVGRGVWLKTFQNGNGHLFFGTEALRDINLALAEYYGEVLADCYDDDDVRPAKSASTAVSKDLQYYPTPEAVVATVMSEIAHRLPGANVLEPSCGCGRFLDAARAAGAKVYGFEVDPGRAALSRSKGHPVVCGNFLEAVPDVKFDYVVMNPPFYGKHYAKHVRHALTFLKPGGTLVTILPSTARYDHGLLDDLRPKWRDLPAGAFSESGTNICTSIATILNAVVKGELK